METQTKKGVTSFYIKVVAIVTMFIDHVGAVILERQLVDPSKALVSGSAYYYKLYSVYRVMRCIGRIAFPLFIFLLVQGFIHTRNRLKYALRLGLFCLISEVPFDMAFKNSYFDLSYQSVFFTLLLGFLFMCVADFIGKKNIPPVLGYIALVLNSAVIGYFLMWLLNDITLSYNYDGFEGVAFYAGVAIFAALTVGVEIFICRKKPFVDLSRLALSILALIPFLLAAEFLKTDYSAGGVFAIAAAYAFRSKYSLCLSMAVLVLTVTNVIEAIAFFGLFLVLRYNGQRGKSMKYFFYAFYPCHLLLIALFAKFIGL